jgi:hypothetical protein
MTTTDANAVALGAILDTLTLIQAQLDAMSDAGQRIEATHKVILNRLDTIDSGQATVTDLTPILETMVGRSIKDREKIRAQFSTIAVAIGFAHSAANGNQALLPVDVEDDPLLERFIIAQPANLASGERALTNWQATVPSEGTAELTAILKEQYTPSPTDTPETRVLRYRMAAITRATIEGRGAAAPTPPTTTRSVDRSAAACMIRSQQLAKIWRAGESTALYAEPELAGAFDLFVLASRQAGPRPEGQPTPELAALHGELAALIETGSRPTLADARFPRTANNMIAPEAERDR